MEITEIRIKLMEGSEDRLRGFCSITIDRSFVIRDLKIIDGSNGPFVAMPSRKLCSNCHRCRHKNHLRANYCNHCGAKLQKDSSDYTTPQKLYADVAHPINSACRDDIQNAILAELDAELSRCKQPGYRSNYDDDFETEPDGPHTDSQVEQPSHESEGQNDQEPAEVINDTLLPKQLKSSGAPSTSFNTATAESHDSSDPRLDAPLADTPATATANEENSNDSRIDQQAADTVPRPFSAKGKGRIAGDHAASSSAEDDDSFGAGIF